ncbi:MAG TPA: family 2A encapsulin nanocompartment cargo protein cysteine desulfurase [Methylocystis sp.]|nr:family 2A encapsulin nanocompartment cargo protein cysteine desulfurase [Methylocystis sp.]
MSSAQSIPASPNMPATDVPSHEAVDHHAPGPFDPQMIAQMANAFFQLQPQQAPPAPIAPGVPIAAPLAPEIPGPSVVTTVAPYAPARLSYGPPDVPPTSIPSVVPTPNVAAPAAPTNAQPGARPLGLPDPPQPGASPGALDGASPGAIDYAAIPRLLGDGLGFAPSNENAAPFTGYAPSASSSPDEELYFLNGRSGAATPGSPPAAHGFAFPSFAPKPDASAVPAPAHPSQTPEIFALSGPSEADPHRFSDLASLATPPAPAPLEGLQSGASPGAAGPAASDALYFVSHAGGHPGLIETVPAQPKEPAPAPGYEPQLAAATPQTRQAFDPYRVKRDFPILQQQVHGKPLVWLDNAATTQKPQSVIDRLTHFYEYENSNIHRAAHALAARSTDAYEAAREKVRRFLKAPNVKDIIFVRGATEGINLVAQAWGRRNVQQGDEIVISWLEHHANIVPWQQLCAEKGARLRIAPVDDRGQLILEEYEKLLNPKTRIVAVTQVSNALGTVTPVHEITAMAHRHGARVLIDGAQSVPHIPVDVQSIDCDFFVFSGHKVFGPTGIGVVYGKDEVLEHMPPWQGGGNMIADVTFEKTIYQGPPDRFEAGTGSIADAVGLGAAIDYVESIGMEVIGRYEHDLLIYATEKMRLVPGLTFIGTAAEKASVLSFVLRGHDPSDVGKALDREGIAVRAGHHCAQPILRRFGLEATVRPSLAFYNTCADVDALVAALMRLQSGQAAAP